MTKPPAPPVAFVGYVMVGAITLVAMFVIGMAIWLANQEVIPAYTPSFSTVHPHHKVQEDDPRWDCATMGNHICGGDER